MFEMLTVHGVFVDDDQYNKMNELTKSAKAM